MANTTPNPLQGGFSRFTQALAENGAFRHIVTILLALLLVGLAAGALMLGANEGAASLR